jgi:MauM/NapG family ferredoxin protein
VKAPRLQRVLQALSLGAFLALLWLASFRLAQGLTPDLFLWLDPLGAAGSMLAARTFIPALLFGLVVIASALIVGRFFCGHICPMGATLDLAQWLLRIRKRKNSEPAPGLRQVKHGLLAACLGSSLLGVSLVFWLAPMPLVTRFWGLTVFPVVRLALDSGLAALRPLAQAMDWRALGFAVVPAARFETALFVALLFAALFALLALAPRFWCRCLCPAGALLALFAGRPAWRRSVSEDCTRCGACIRACPMGAIPEEPRETRHRECIACLRCVRVCPESAAHFRLFPGSAGAESFVPGRRRFLASGLSGASLAALALSGLDSPALKEGVAGTVVDPDRVRPPGALPEEAFLARCLRCGECVAACPTNTLQPAWLQAGVWGLFSPIAMARRGACDPDCAECGRVCPTGAVRPLPLNEKMWAKMGTAVVLRQKCLAWEWGKPCLVCKEVCPYGAIEMRRVESSPVTVPFVLGTRCVGCGSCENRCPVQATAAIQVEPMGSLRLAQGSFEQTGRGMGLDIRRAVKPGAPAGPENLAPGTSPFDPAPGAAPQAAPGAPSLEVPAGASPFDPPVTK